MRAKTLFCAMLLVAGLACGGDSTTGPGGNNNNLANLPLSAVINGVQWGSPVPSVSYNSNNSILAIAGVDLAITASISFGVRAQVPGVYSLAYQNPVGGSAIITMGGKGWGTAFQGGTGTLTITALTTHRVTGTFTFTAAPASGGATGTVTVTNGKFDITY